jgi:uncharacterized membrane protein
MDALRTTLVLGTVLLLLDAVWLTLRSGYHETLFMAVQRAPLTLRVAPAIGVYLLLPVIIYLTALRDAKSWKDAALKGALTGALLYGFYDLTNYATLNGWTLQMSVTDTLWGTTLCAGGAGLAYVLTR